MKYAGALAAVLVFIDSLVGAPKSPQVIVAGDVASTASSPLRPEPGQPIYYLLLGSAEMNLGKSFGRMPPPNRKAMEIALVKTLEQQGFILAKVGDPVPQIALAVSWGTVSIDDIPEKAPPGIFGNGEEIFEMIYNENRKHMWRVTGALKSDGHNLTLVEGDKLSEAVGSDRVYISVIAFDVSALRKKQKAVLWRTHMSVDVLQSTLPDSFATMLATAGPYFGRATDKPLFFDERIRNAKVTPGELKVLEIDVPSASSKHDPDRSDRKK